MKKLNMLLLAVLCTGTAQAADLLTAYKDALAYDAQFAAARAALDAGREKLPQGRAGLLPTVSAAGNTFWNDESWKARSFGIDTDAKYNSNGWSVTLSQPLFRMQNWVAYNQAELSVARSEAQFVAARQALIVRVAQAYFDVLLAQEALTTTRAQKVAISEQLAAAKRSFEVGTATITDTNEAQSRYDLIIAQELATENDLAVKREILRAVVGKDEGELKPLKPGTALLTPQPADINQWVSMAENANPVVQASQASHEIAAREIERQHAGHYPTLDLVAGHNNMHTKSMMVGANQVDGDRIGLQLTIPIYSGGTVVSQEREAAALKEKAAADLDNTRRQAALDARSAYLGVTSGLSQVKAFEAAMISSKSSLDSNKMGYDVGVRINIDVLNAQSQLYTTQQSLAKARLDTLLALLRLKLAAGNLSETDIQAVNALLD